MLPSSTMVIPSTETLRFLTGVFARGLDRHADVLDAPELVLPNRAFFPDAIDVSPEGIETLLARLVTYTPLREDVELRLLFIEPESAEAKSCSSGACGPAAGAGALLDPALAPADGAGAYGIPLDVSLARNPIRLTTSLARSVGGAVMLEAGHAGNAPTNRGDLGVEAEVMAQLCGLGVLLLAGSNLFMKGCSGVKRLAGTTLNTEEHAFLLALFAFRFDRDLGAVRKLVEPTQREALDWASAYVAEYAPTFRLLREAPALLAGGAFEFERRAGLFARIFGAKREAAAPAAVMSSARPVPSDAARERLRAARLLVDAALGDDAAGAE
jgi:hypothetical protein